MVARTGLILGRAITVWDEIKAAKKLHNFDVIIAVNRMGRDYKKPFHHWVSYHPNFFIQWKHERREPLPEGLMYWTGIVKKQRLGDPARLKIPLQFVRFSGGSSGMLAVKVALDGLGLERVVLAGVPMENTPRYDDPSKWREAEAYWQSWLAEMEWMAGRVRSMSGRTRKHLGAPDATWLAEGKVTDVGEGVATAQDAGRP